MLTAARVYPETTLDEWIGKIWSDEPAEEFYSRLHENGFKVNLFGNLGIDFRHLEGKTDNSVSIGNDELRIDRKALYHAVESIAAFRYLPLALKQFSMPDAHLGNDCIDTSYYCIDDNREYLDNLHLVLSDEDKNYFIVEHIMGTHEFTAPYYVETVDCLNIFNEYIRQMKELGIYDDSVIMITADHGDHAKPDDMPIWYIKKAGAHGDKMGYCSAPVHHSDYLATCLNALGLSEQGDEEIFGRAVFDIAEDEKRERIVFQRKYFCDDSVYDPELDPSHGYFFGYRYTGNKNDLVSHEKSDPPDEIIDIDEKY